MPAVVLDRQRVTVAGVCLGLAAVVVLLVVFLSMGLNTPILRACAGCLLCLHSAAPPTARAGASPLLHRANAPHQIAFVAFLRVSVSSRVPAQLDVLHLERDDRGSCPCLKFLADATQAFVLLVNPAPQRYHPLASQATRPSRPLLRTSRAREALPSQRRTRPRNRHRVGGLLLPANGMGPRADADRPPHQPKEGMISHPPIRSAREGLAGSRIGLA